MMRLLVAGDFRWFSGSSHIIGQYVEHGLELGVEVAVSSELGTRDETIASVLPFCGELGWATHLLVIYEGRPFLSAEELARIDRVIPRSHRAVVDADGHWAPVTTAGDDDNTWPCGAPAWREAIAAVSDLVLQPRILGPFEGAISFPYFGMPDIAPAREPLAGPRVDLQYIGNNWFRLSSLVEVFRGGRAALGASARLRVCGRGWDGSVLAGFEAATYADPLILAGLGIEVEPPVPFGNVVASMGNAVVSPVLVRPVLSSLGLLTPRMLETVAAATIPVYRQEDQIVGMVWQDGGELCLGAEPEAKLNEIFSNPARFQALATDLRERASDTFSYPRLLRRLREIFP